MAERIAQELGEEIGQTVGYQVRFTTQTSKATRVKVMTDGILLAEIPHDPQLRRYSVIIVDEAHERSLNIDFLLGYLRNLLPQRPDLKVIITSATIDPERFARHFGRPLAAGEDHADAVEADDGGRVVPAPIIEVSGRTYPVEIRYRPLTDEPSPTTPRTMRTTPPRPATPSTRSATPSSSWPPSRRVTSSCSCRASGRSARPRTT